MHSKELIGIAENMEFTTKSGKKQTQELTTKDMILTSENTYTSISNIQKQSNIELFEIKGFLFNRILATGSVSVYVKEKSSNLKAKWITLEELSKNELHQKYYIASFAHFYNGILDDGVYDGMYVWIPFIVNKTNKLETVYQINTDATGVIINRVSISMNEN